ncbi:MAG: sigma-70 family RNA polymerase sigma factor [Myxococcales bacterium]|nr:sigma-70 family RNA polymerase sigma factor [Myxococcales bacterium]
MRAPTAPPKGAGTDKKRLVADNLPYVRAIAARIKDQLPKEIEFDDLVAYGTQGLLEAAQRYDGKHGASFTTFAYYRVRGAIFDGLRGMGWLPRGEYARARFEERAAAYLANLSERDAGAEAFERGDRAIEDEVRDLASALGGVAAVFITSLNLDDEHGVPDGAPHPQDRLEQREVERTLRSVLGCLPEKERRLIELYYFEEKTLEEAGASLGLSKSWASRLHARAIDLLRNGLERQGPPAEPSPTAPGQRRRRASSKR